MKRNNISRRFRMGCAEFSGIGGYPEEMLSEVLKRGIRIHNVKVTESGISGAVSPADYYKVSETARKNGVRLRAGKRYGLWFDIARYRSRIGLCAGFLLFILMIALWQNSVRSIVIEGDLPRAQISRILEECNIRIGAPNDSLLLSKAEHRIMAEVEDCAWADVSREGFRVRVMTVKADPPPEIEENAPRNIVAKRSAMIVRQVTRKGAKVVENGSGVNAGDLLVSGTVCDGRDKILFLRADAEIIGEWSETREFFVPYNETVSVPCGEQKTFKYLVCGDDEYPLFFGKARAENSVYSEEVSPLKIFGADTVFKIRTGVYTAYSEREIRRSPDDAVSELRRQKSAYEENFYSEYDIISLEERYYPTEDGIRLVVDYTLQGDIAETVPIEVGDEQG